MTQAAWRVSCEKKKSAPARLCVVCVELLSPPRAAGVDEGLPPVNKPIKAAELEARRRVHQDGPVERQKQLAVGRRVGADKEVNPPELRVPLVSVEEPTLR